MGLEEVDSGVEMLINNREGYIKFLVSMIAKRCEGNQRFSM